LKKLIVALGVLVFASAANANPATTLMLDVSDFSFYDACTDESVRPNLGETLQAIIRFSEDNDGLHLVNRMAGHVTAYGVSSGDDYMISALFTPLQNVFQNAQLQDGNGVVQTFTRWEIVKPADPVGVSISQQILRIVFRGNDVVDVTAEPLDTVCSGG
jgi:hypothetical protein